MFLFLPFLLTLILTPTLLYSYADLSIMGSQHESTTLASPSPVDGSPYSVMGYISRCGQSLNVCRFGRMRFVGHQLLIYDSRLHKYRVTTVRSWIKCWLSCGSRDACSSPGAHERRTSDLQIATKRLTMRSGLVSS